LELFSQSQDLLLLELAHSHATPTLTGLPHRGKDQLQAAFLGPEAGNDFRPSLLFDKGSLKDIGGADNSVDESENTYEDS
jgi:hypothetical protein